MLRSLLFVPLFALLSACSTPLPHSIAEMDSVREDTAPYHTPYDRSALQKLSWLAGTWKCKDAVSDNRQTFLFHTPQMLEVMQTEAGSQKASQFFRWKDGHYYFGQNSQWMVTWISEKNIRLDPVAPGWSPMTWSRVNEDKWHLLRHTDQGDEILVMERTDSITS